MTLRPYRDTDQSGVVETMRSVYDEYGFAWDEDGYCSDLKRIPELYERFWVVEHDDEVVGFVGFSLHERVPGEPGSVTSIQGVPRSAATDCELHRLYVRSSARGHGLGVLLTQTVIDEARSRGCQGLEFWSDKKLTHAHAMYQRMGARIVGERICPGDPDESPEWGFYLALSDA